MNQEGIVHPTSKIMFLNQYPKYMHANKTPTGLDYILISLRAYNALTVGGFTRATNAL